MATLSAAITASATALSVQRTRIEVAVSNMANAESTRGANGEPYRRRNVLLAPQPVASFDDQLGGMQATGVQVTAITEDQAPFKRRYDPGHPDADGDGFVSMPNIDAPEEMVDMMGASRAYQANLAAIGMIRELVSKALELGR
ncbi:MAG: flagellar basal body rod protein FlgC [Vicinamibacterales bacterium]